MSTAAWVVQDRPTLQDMDTTPTRFRSKYIDPTCERRSPSAYRPPGFTCLSVASRLTRHGSIGRVATCWNSPQHAAHLNPTDSGYTAIERGPFSRLSSYLRLDPLMATRSLLQIEAIVVEHLDMSYEPMHNNIHRPLRLSSLVQATITRI
jgi:hypothetical protein